MHEIKEKVKPICDMMDKLCCVAKTELEKGADNVDTQEFGEVVDMIKDLADAKKNFMKAAYYESIVKAMKEAEEDERKGMMMPYGMDYRAGYDAWRYPSSGRFASKGHGTRMGYVPPFMDPMNYFDDDTMMGMFENPRMGYQGDGSGSSRSRSSGGRSGGMSQSGSSRSGYGRPYDLYKETRRYYTETRSPKKKEEMDHYAVEHVAEAVDTISEIMDDADPELKKELKKHLSRLGVDIRD